MANKKLTLCDVIVVEKYRGKGLGRLIMISIIGAGAFSVNYFTNGRVYTAMVFI